MSRFTLAVATSIRMKAMQVELPISSGDVDGGVDHVAVSATFDTNDQCVALDFSKPPLS